MSEETTWTCAQNFKILNHPVPGSSGINSMRAYATIAEDEAPVPGTAYFAFNESHGMLIILYVRMDGRISVTKEYIMNRKKSFDVVKLIRRPGRLAKHSRTAFENLVNYGLEKK